MEPPKALAKSGPASRSSPARTARSMASACRSFASVTPGAAKKSTPDADGAPDSARFSAVSARWPSTGGASSRVATASTVDAMNRLRQTA